MDVTDIAGRQALMRLDREELASYQLERFNRLLAEIRPVNSFYSGRLAGFPDKLDRLEQLADLPFTFKDDLVEGSGISRFAANRTWPLDRYVRMHQTSGTRGRPLIVLDTAADWNWWMDAWEFVLDSAGITPADRVVMAFSFGPFVGFWSAHDAVVRRGALVAPAGGMNTLARVEMIGTIEATTVFCTPSYAMHLAEVAAHNHRATFARSVNKVIVAGEPGGSIPEVRDCIQRAWQARVVDHAGASEVGPWGFADPDGSGIFVNEACFLAEFYSVETSRPASSGELSELVITTLGRAGSPVIRYRTGDLVRPVWPDSGECRFVFLEGGVLGRVDDMLIVRGVNIFPSSIERILRSFPEIVEYRMTAYRQGQMDALRIEIEDRLQRPARVAQELQLQLGLKIQVECVEPGSLPRFELKGNRFVDQRRAESRP